MKQKECQEVPWIHGIDVSREWALDASTDLQPARLAQRTTRFREEPSCLDCSWPPATVARADTSICAVIHMEDKPIAQKATGMRIRLQGIAHKYVSYVYAVRNPMACMRNLNI